MVSKTTDARSEIVGQGKKAFLALQKFYKENEKKSLFPESAATVNLLVTYKKVALHQQQFRVFVKLPHSHKSAANSSVCLILPDLTSVEEAKRDADVDAQARQWADILRTKHNLTGSDISKIFTYTQLTREYSQAADKAKLANTYDIFLVEAKLLKKAMSFLGSKFMTSAKKPFPVHVESANFATQVQNAYSQINLPLEPLKDSVTIALGNLGQSTAHLTANLEAVVGKFLEACPGGENNIRSMYLNTQKVNASLPIYVDFDSVNNVRLPKTKVSKTDKISEVFDDCSTLPDGLAVKVRRNGQVRVVNEKTRGAVLYPTMDDEWEKRDDIKPRKFAPKRKQKLVPKKVVASKVVKKTKKKQTKVEPKVETVKKIVVATRKRKFSKTML